MIKLKSLLTEIVGKIEVPEEPGTTPIPTNHIRVYHYTNTTTEIVREEGLKMSHAKGETYGEPNAIWCSTSQPGNFKIFVEFSIAIDDPRFNRFYGPAPDPSQGAQFYKNRGSDFTLFGDVSPSEFIAIHEPWHRHYRYIIENDMVQSVLDGEYDYILKDDKDRDTKKAVLVIKHNFGK